jgi:hypothetical protein
VADSDTVCGTVRAIAQHRASGLFPTEAVSFGLERTDSAGDALPPVSVEFRGRRGMDGLDDGDDVEVTGTWTEDILQARRIINHSRGTQLQRRQFSLAEGRILILTIVAGLSIIAAVTASVMALSGGSGDVLDGGGWGGDGGADDVRVDSVSVISFGGTPDHPELAELAVDGNSGTAWPTDAYRKPDAIPRYKNGVGLLLQLSEATALSSATINVSSRGTQVQIRSARSAYPSTLAETNALTPSTPVSPGDNKIAITSSAETSYVLVWVTKLGTTNGDNVATISEITLRS